jgi:hypothetical protein
MEWYLIIDGVRRGPMSKASVLVLIAKGVVTPNTPARRPDMPDWLAIRYIKEFDLSPHAAAPVPVVADPDDPYTRPIPPPSMSPAPATIVSQAAAAKAAPQKPENPLLAYFGRHWRGEYSLAVSYWINWTLLGMALGKPAESFIDHAMSGVQVSDDPRPLFAAVMLLGPSMLALSVWQMVGVTRSALRSKRDSGKSWWPNVALFFVAISALLYAALTCLLLPAVPQIVATFFASDRDQYRVEPTADGKELQVSGWLGLGVAAEVRKALKQHPQIGVIVLDSDDGRASAGVALGNFLAEGDYTTLVRQRCASPCSTAFAGGKRRLLEYGGTLAFHQPVSGRSGDGDDDELKQITDASAAFLVARGVDQGFVAKAFSRSDAEQWAPSPRALFKAGVITAAVVAGQEVDAENYATAAVQAILDGTAALPPFKALKALDAAAFDASQARLRKLLVEDGSGDPNSEEFRHAVRRELRDAAMRYLPATSDSAAQRYLKARLDQLRILRNSDPDVCRALIYPQFGHAADPAAYLTEATAAEDTSALEAVLVDAQAGDKRAPRDAQSAADRQQVLKSVLGRYPPVFSSGINHVDEFRALDSLSICAFHIALLEDIQALPAPRNGSALRRLTPEVLGR